MRHTLPRLNGSVLLLVLVGQMAFAWAWAWASAYAQPPTGNGQQMIAQAAEKMGTYNALECRIRQRVRLFGQDLNGQGTYQQVRIGDQMCLRLELKLPIGERTTYQQQINDGEHLWIRREGLDDQHLSMIDLRKVRSAWSQEKPRADRTLAIGGISQMLFGLEDQFEFKAPRPGKLGKERVWILDGTWKTSGGAGQGAAADTMPHLPHSVLVVLSRDDLLSLFPFRIEYYRDQPGRDGVSQRQTIMSIEFFEVAMLRNIDSRQFTYSAGDQEIVDETDTFLEQH